MAVGADGASEGLLDNFCSSFPAAFTWQIRSLQYRMYAKRGSLGGEFEFGGRRCPSAPLGPPQW